MKKILKRIFNPDGTNMIPEDKDAIDYLILNKALEVAGIDSNGELLYAFTPKIKEIMPALYKEHMNHVNSEIMVLWEKGFVDIDLLSEEPVVTLTKKSFNESEISKLPEEQRWGLNEIKRLLKKRNF